MEERFRTPITRRLALGTMVAAAAGVAVGVRQVFQREDHGPTDEPQVGDQPQAAQAPTRPQPEVLFGAWVPGGETKVRELEQQLGRDLDIEHWYQGWGVSFIPDRYFDLRRARNATVRGAIPMVTWEPWNYLAGTDQPMYALRNIVDGHFDSYIRQNAEQMKQVEGPVWLRFAHEMNIANYPWSIGVNGNTAHQFVEAWRRIVHICRAEGADNVQFIWSVNAPGPGDPPLDQLFPGDAYISYAGIDSYNWGDAQWRMPNDLFDDGYRQIRLLTNRPIIITETGCATRGGSKPDWIRAFGRDLRANLPAVPAVVWFNENREADWRLDSDPASLDAARSTFRIAPFL